uniref:Uncharacterized protein n=1 Tax=Chaetoceros debilis TaxID=122233 RepID=A0A7S3Q3P8_9STRA|mmetsp:Transcript_22638/g.33533  ORF Transcript_22638/g.33533 Transcript_22638/m.33533 type:complete len:1100 (-) Transcript_22638:2081-5380(-)|eukprot:CAMPEP_0194082046 /NCGR_PEP_ID=MMETSP0149-20130528/7655_1 /TAXON_ID=122233 /ORGANISM="Chaetoceros debilis, Strain MM31A-1" /LENGTH=1099 /DNA_ID=CAMNT_0038764097 /DNA_START=160 /DNA_END=3459 /DNA_ORIENTATION=-
MPPLGIFRGLGGTIHGSSRNVTADDKSLKVNESSHGTTLKKRLADMTESQAKMEMDYLNIINSLNSEKEDARQEIQKRMRESTSLSDSNISLISKVSHLELKVKSLQSDKADMEAIVKKNSVWSPPSTPSSGQRQREFENIKNKLKINTESNEVMNSRVQKIRDKYAKRKMETDEMSDTGSVMSIGSTRSCVSMVASPRQHMVEVKKLEMNYEKQLKLNGKLGKRFQMAEQIRAESLQELKRLRNDSEEKLNEHKSEIEQLKSELRQAQINIDETREDINAESVERSEQLAARDSELLQAKASHNQDLDRIKELEALIKEKDSEIRTLKVTLESFSDTEKRLEELTIELIQKQNAHNFDVEKLREALSTANNTIEQMKKDASLQDSEGILGEEKRQITILQTAINDKDVEIAQLISDSEKNALDRSEKVEKQLPDSNIQLKELQSELSHTQTELEEMEAKRILALKDKEAKEIILSTLHRKLENENQKVAKLESTIEEKELKLEMVQMKAAEIATRVDTSSPRNDEIKDGMGPFELKAGDVNTQVDSSGAQRVDKKDGIRTFENEAEIKHYVTVAKQELDFEDEKEIPNDEQQSFELNAIRSQLELEKTTVGELRNTIKQKEDEITKIKLDVTILAKVSEELSLLEIEFEEAKSELQKKDDEMSKLDKDKSKLAEKIEAMELDFVVTQQKNANIWEEMEDLRDKYEIEVNHCKNLKEELQKSQTSISSARSGTEIEVEKVESEEALQLKNEVKQKDTMISELRSRMEEKDKVQIELEAAKNELTTVRDNMKTKEERLERLTVERSQSSSRLEFFELDMIAIQQKSARTFEELEDLKEKYDYEIQQKADLQETIDQFSPEEILAQAKEENEVNLKQKDGEIDGLKKKLTDANVSKTEIELKLMDVMNDVIASQSTRDMMKGELEERLRDENERAESLQVLIKAKEDDMESMRKDFDTLRVQMEKETDLKRNEISELNGEVVEKASALSARDREFLHFKAEMDQLRLVHAGEMASLQKQIDESGANEREIDMIRAHNNFLQDEVTNLNKELQKLHMNGNNIVSPDSSSKILRTRNNQLKNEVDKLQTKLRKMKNSVTRFEL